MQLYGYFDSIVQYDSIEEITRLFMLSVTAGGKLSQNHEYDSLTITNLCNYVHSFEQLRQGNN